VWHRLVGKNPLLGEQIGSRKHTARISANKRAGLPPPALLATGANLPLMIVPTSKRPCGHATRDAPRLCTADAERPRRGYHAEHRNPVSRLGAWWVTRRATMAVPDRSPVGAANPPYATRSGATLGCTGGVNGGRPWARRASSQRGSGSPLAQDASNSRHGLARCS